VASASSLKLGAARIDGLSVAHTGDRREPSGDDQAGLTRGEHTEENTRYQRPKRSADLG
jgi:hypothetical protein